MKHRRSITLLATLLSLHCSAPTTPGAVAPAPHAAAAAPSSALGSPPTLTAWRQVSFPDPPERILFMGKEPDGTRLIAVGGFRVKQRGEQLEFAKQALYVDILRSCRAGTGWVHVTSERDVYRSDGFLGKLEVVGHVDNLEFVQCGPQAVTPDPQPVFWSDTGAQRLAWEWPITWASFSDAKRGVALAFPDLWLKTSDAGRSFRRASKAMSVAQAFTQLPPQRYGLLGDADLSIALRGWARRALRSEAGRALSGPALSDGTALRPWRSEQALWIELRKPNGEFTSVRVPTNCHEVEPWGAQTIAVCSADPGLDKFEIRSATLRRVYPTGQELPPPPRPPQDDLVLDHEGHYLFAQGQIVDYPQQTTRPLLRFDGKTWQVFEDVTTPPVAVQHGWLLLDEPPRVVSAEQPRQPAVQLAADGYSVNVAEVTMSERSVVFVRHRTDDPSKTELVELELPTGRELRVLPYADAPQVDGHPPELRCDAHHCDGSGTTAWTRLPDEDEPELLPTPPRHDYLSDNVELAAPFELSSYDCEVVTNMAKKDVELGGLLPLAKDSQYQQIAGIPTIGGMLDASASGTLSWHGVDATGAFTVTTTESKAVAPLAAALPHSTDDVRSLLPVLITRQFVLLNEDVDADTQHRLLLVDQGGNVRELIATADFDVMAAPLPDGRTLLDVSFDHHDDVINLKSDGSVDERRSFVNTHSLTTYPALRAGAAGVVALGAAHSAFFSLEAETPGTPVLVAEPRSLQPCRGKPAADQLRLFMNAPAEPRISVAGFVPENGLVVAPKRVIVVDSSAKSNCLRGVFLDGAVSTELTSSGPWLQGRAVGRTKTHKLVCHSAPLPTRPGGLDASDN